jgi:predicted transcriptional regulator
MRQEQDRPEQEPCPCGCPASPTDGDERIDRLEPVVLMELLDPPQGGDHVHDISRHLHQERALVEAAVGRLVAGGLAVRKGDIVEPTPQAVYYHRLDPPR